MYSLLSGAFAGCVNKTLLMPLDVVRRRLQVRPTDAFGIGPFAKY